MPHRPDLAERIRLLPTSRAALEEAGRLKWYQRVDWFDVNIAVMDTVLEAKFAQHLSLRHMLLETNNDTLIEDSPVRGDVLHAHSEVHGDDRSIRSGAAVRIAREPPALATRAKPTRAINDPCRKARLRWSIHALRHNSGYQKHSKRPSATASSSAAGTFST